MVINGKEVSFPATMKFSFFKLFEKLEQLVGDSDHHLAEYAKSILKEMEKYPDLKDGFEDLDLLKKYDKQIKKLCRLLFPDPLLSNEIKALMPPFYWHAVFKSTRLENILKSSGKEFDSIMDEVEPDMLYLYCCYFILTSYYGYSLPSGGFFNVELYDKKQRINRTYKMGINADMTEFIPTDKAVDITQADFEELVDNHGNMEIWKKKFPPNSWIMRGITIANMMDNTVDQSLANITANMLIKTPETFQKVRQGLRTLLNNPDLETGVLIYDQKNLLTINKQNVTSILLGSNGKLGCDDNMCEGTLNTLFTQMEPLVIPNVDTFHKKVGTPMAEMLKKTNFKSYIMAPLIHEDELQGFIELASKKPYELNSISVARINEISPVLAMAHKRFKTEAQNAIEAIIQQECTTIHPSVKWRFVQEAEKFMHKRLNNEQPMFKDIIFDHLYPLYGQIDIKESSTKRNKAVSADLLKQISEVRKILKSALKITGMPAYEELIFRLDTFKKETQSGLNAGSEHKILGFLKSDIYPVFNHLKVQPKLSRLIQKYYDLLDPELKTLYEERRKYDTSVNLLNQRLASYLDEKQIEAQQMFPHYFERYKTDGVEYNIYIGESISDELDFDPIYLQNLRIWQLIVMCELENEYKNIIKELPTALEVASLILVYSTALSVHFRMDEKRFDVEGAYNARYEIVKKRVDKAHIKGTKERITQPGKIAIIYSQESDAREYRTYLKFMQAKGYVKPGIEDVALEDLQGITGLKAMRVSVNYNDKKKEEIEISNLLKSIEGTSVN